MLIIFQHFQLGELGTYPITIGLFAGVVLLAVSSRRISMGALLVTTSIVCIPNALVQIVSPSLRGGSSTFFGTFSLFVLAAFIVAQYDPSTVRARFAHGAMRGILFSLSVVVLISVLQVATGSRGSLAWFNLFGEHQYLYEYNPHLEFNPIPRAAAFYLEPSYAAFIVGSLAVMLIAARRHVKTAWILGTVGMLTIRSATGLLVFALVAMVALLASRSKWRLPAIVGLVLAAAVAVPYLSGRLDSTFTTGSSAYYRLIGPLQILRDTLNHYPLGHPFGSLRDTVADYGILNGAATGDSLDNGFYVFVFYFGWIGLVGTAALIAWALRRTLQAQRTGRTGAALAAVWSVGSLLFSGGVMLPEFVLTLWLLFAVVHSSAAAESLKDQVGKHDANLDRHYNLQR
ncbi:putative colanic acid polymerase WcaD [Curtobacterium sp. C1]|uniref:O-antigen ligase family protein n=1 Tax=Curtobacterium sp. C1 TaxID=2898151 RepID=UPI001E2CA31C|nr:putative colanic acid polymerase WcaD [Curtobacterium sp. C1]UFU14568.1 putative colanic acid polymerase WcaD [Curtobacterium sp. C1]